MTNVFLPRAILLPDHHRHVSDCRPQPTLTPIHQVTHREPQQLTLGPGRVYQGPPTTFFRRHFCFSGGGMWPPDQAPRPVRAPWHQGQLRASGTRLRPRYRGSLEDIAAPLLPPATPLSHLVAAATPLLPLGRLPRPPGPVSPAAGVTDLPPGLG